MWKILFGVAGGIVLAAIIFMFCNVIFAGLVLKSFDSAIKQIQPIKAINQAPQNIGVIQPPPIPKTKDQLIQENSKKAYVLAQNEIIDFKAQYKKPDSCYNINDNVTRVYCANEFIKARAAYDALHK